MLKPVATSFLLLLVGSLAVSLCAQEKPAKPAEKSASAKQRAEFSITPEREAAVMAFVEQNHVELKELLTYLRDNRRKDYERAIRELYRDAERIHQLKDREPKQHELELKAWTIKSRIQLLTAHLAMGESDELRTQLRDLLGEQMDVRSALLQRERERAQERLAKIDQEVSRLQSDRQKIIENQLQVLTRSAADSKKNVKIVKKGAQKPTSKKPDKSTVSQPDK